MFNQPSATSRISDLSRWHRCDAFRETSDAETDADKVDQILLRFFSLRVGLPYTMAVLQLAKKCQFARQRLEYVDSGRTIVESYLKFIQAADEVRVKWHLSQLMQVEALKLKEDMSKIIDEIARLIKAKASHEEIVKYVLQEAKIRADSAVERLLKEKGPVTPLTPVEVKQSVDTTSNLIPSVLIILSGLGLILGYAFSRNN